MSICVGSKLSSHAVKDPANAKMPTNEGVEVKQSPISGAGKGLFARNAFSPGDMIVAVDRPLVTELEIDRMLDTCAWCCQRGATDPVEKMRAAAMGLPTGSTEIKSCTGCQRVGYCSKACQSKAWKREHKHECKIIGVKDRPDLPPGVRAVIKILGRLKADSKAEIVHVHDILNLWPAGDPKGLNEIGTQDKKKFDDFQLLGRAAWHYCDNAKIDGLDAQSISTGLVSNIMNNSFTLSSPLDDVNLGIGFDPLICSANHSCDPNASIVFNQPRQEIRALRAIKPGDEIFIKYVEVTNPFSVRQAELKKNYFFTCQCIKCKKGAGLEADQFLKRPEDLESEFHKLADTLASRHESTLSKFLVGDNDVKAQRRVAAIQAEAYAVLENEQAPLDEVKKVIRLCIGSKLWRWTRQPVPQLCRRLLALYLESGSIYQAFRLGVKLHFEILPALYPQEFYPDRLINAWVVSTLINVLCGPAHQDLFQELAQGGVELRLIYFGFLFYVHEHTPRMFPNTPFGKVIQNTYEQIMAGVSIPEADIKEKIKTAWPSLEALAHNVDISSL
ncbi:SET domain-containing protein [Xylaria cf. heliscus]|nr:SET domain-containing protein [Xylaria cf. heliscus]